MTSLPHANPTITRPASSAGTLRANRPITTASSPSWSTRVLDAGYGMGSPGPMTDVDGLMKMIGSSGTSPPISWACSP